MEWKGCGATCSWPNFLYYSDMFLNRLRKTIQISVMIFGRQFEIQKMPIINIYYDIRWAV